ncbi:MAG: bifunctional adenosylcobinamide kinase/adenosylcobinamide-phosphate guanylyltransferase [Coriobacteriia bacterium]|nr:bifunctional adenosylcobinamide kinase/adenosylcobinamide-phosphate guanylyltransferase [Coriobacteriia bacterium]
MALVVITGGARSGKSAAAQRLAERRLALGEDVVVAVFATASDPEMADRIAAHQYDRPAGFAVIEAAGDAGWLAQVPDESIVLLDCLGTYAGDLMQQAWESESPGESLGSADEIAPQLAERFEAMVSAAVDVLLVRDGHTIVVTNEVGSGVVPAFATGRLFRDVLGRANARLIGSADRAYVAIGGRLLDLERLPRDAEWPTD